MTGEISRRLFLVLTGSAFVLPPRILGDESVPSQLDHTLLGCSDLRRGIDYVERRAGVRAAFGGVHPGRGTQNALLSLGERRYLEIIAPDPKQEKVVWHAEISKLTEPRLIGWAAHVDDIDRVVARLRQAGVAFDDPQPGSRQRLDGSVLRWKTLTLKDDQSGLLPFFIEWSAQSPHPSVDAPGGCSLVRFEMVLPDPKKLADETKSLGVDIPVAKGERAQLRATLSSPKGELTFTSYQFLRVTGQDRKGCRRAKRTCYTLWPVPRGHLTVWGGSGLPRLCG